MHARKIQQKPHARHPGTMLRLTVLTILSTCIYFGAAAQADPQATFTVTGVAANDVLNVRESASHDSAKVGSLAPGQSNIQQTGRQQNVANATWVEIKFGTQTGWVNAQYLTSAPPQGLEPATPAFFAEDLSCSGTEPFWGLQIRGTKGDLDTLSEGRSELIFTSIRNAQGVPSIWSFHGNQTGSQSPVHLVLEETNQCSDGMSDLVYKYAIRLDIELGPFYAGCCNARSGQKAP